MNYNADELFSFEKTEVGYAVLKYLKTNDPSVTELEIPAEYNGERVTVIDNFSFSDSEYLKRVVVPPGVRNIRGKAFLDCHSLESIELPEGLEIIEYSAFGNTALKSVRLPKSLREIGERAFRSCRELERVEFNSSPLIGASIFEGCPKLPPETVVIGLARSTDITRPLFDKRNPSIMAELVFPKAEPESDCFRPDVFRLLLKNNSFRSLNPKRVLRGIIDENKPNLLPLAEQYGMLEDEKLLKNLISYSAECRRVECTAYLLEFKNRKFGKGSEKRISGLEVDEVFAFEKTDDGYAVAEFLKKEDLRVTELRIPGKYNGEPVVRINSEAFKSAKHLKSVRLPKSLKKLGEGAFAFCDKLESVEFNSTPDFELNVFRGCPKLPPETVVMGLVRSIDITRPVLNEDIPEITASDSDAPCDCFRPDVFELLALNNCFRNCDLRNLLIRMTGEDNPKLFSIAEQYGMFEISERLKNAELLDLLIGSAIENQRSEIADYLRGLRNRNFGFD